MASHNIVYFTGYQSENGYPAKWQMSFLPNTVKTATLHLQLHNQQQTQMALDSKLFCEFYRVKYKKITTYTYMDFHWLHPLYLQYRANWH